MLQLRNQEVEKLERKVRILVNEQGRYKNLGRQIINTPTGKD